jgi:hypothetical protein
MSRSDVRVAISLLWKSAKRASSRTNPDFTEFRVPQHDRRLGLGQLRMTS